MDIEDKELFESAVTDEVPEIAEVPATPEPQADGQPRDDHGRFAPKEQPEPEPQPEPAPQAQSKDEVHVPSWRLREEREARETAERRAQAAEDRLNRQIAELRAQMPRAEPAPRPDLYENPDGFVEHGVRQAVDPIKSEIGQLREFYSRRDAEREFGAEKVKAAYDWIAQGMSSRDPEAVATYQRAMQSMHPFGDLVTAHQQRHVYQQIGGDPEAWFNKQLEQRLADPSFAGSILQKVQQGTRPNPQGQQNNIKLPPSLRSVPSAQSAADDDNDMSDGALFAHATR